MKDIQKILNSGPKIKNHEYHLFANSDWPEHSPWFPLNHLDTESLIEKLFAPITNRMPQTINALKENCTQVVLLLDNGDWYLIYQLKSNGLTLGHYLVGGEPQRQAELSKSVQKKGWIIPNDLAAFYQVHNGFGSLWPFDLFWNSECILPDDKLYLLSDIFSVDGEVDFEYKTEDLLTFYPDGAGNSQCFFRNANSENLLLTVDWDHETRLLSKAQKFWQFVDNRLCKFIEDR